MENTRSDHDFTLWNSWKQSNSEKDLSKLLKNMAPVLYSATKPLQGSASPKILEAEAKIQAMKAFKTYDPNKGTKLSTHVTNQLQKVNRLAYGNMELLSVPEHRRYKYKTFDAARTNLGEDLGRDPNLLELSDELGWSRAEVERFQQENRKELSESRPGVSDLSFGNDPNEMLLSYVHSDLSPEQQSVFEMSTGYGGSEQKDNPSIMQTLKMTIGKLSYTKNLIKKKIQMAMGEYGE